jgi:hypothetical protein
VIATDMRELSSMPDVVDTADVAAIRSRRTCGYATRQTVTHNVDSSTTINVKAFQSRRQPRQRDRVHHQPLALEVTMVGSTMEPLTLRSVTVLR